MKIEPALSAKEWADYAKRGVTLTSWIDDALCANTEDQRKIIALLNHEFPDSDPRKIAREMVTELRGSASAIKQEWPEETETYRGALSLERIADALEAYLPPE